MLILLRESHRLIMTVSFLVQSGSDGSLWHLCYYCVGHSFLVFITGPVVWLCANKLKSLSSVHISLCSHDHMHMTCWSVLAVHQDRTTEEKHWQTTQLSTLGVMNTSAHSHSFTTNNLLLFMSRLYKITAGHPHTHLSHNTRVSFS